MYIAKNSRATTKKVKKKKKKKTVDIKQNHIKLSIKTIKGRKKYRKTKQEQG